MIGRAIVLISCALGALAAVPARALAAESYCEVVLTGAENVKFRESGDAPAGATEEQKELAAKNSAGSDYWISDEDMKKTLTMLYSADKLAAKMAADPRMTALTVNCGTKGTGLSLAAGPKSSYASVPQKPGKHRIVRDEDAKPGDLSLIFHTGKTSYRLAAPGSLELTKFDTTGVAGKFSFDVVPTMATDKGPVHVTGTFSLHCQGRGKCKP